MLAARHVRRSLIVAAAISLFAVEIQAAQELSVQKLIERGALDEAVQRAEGQRENHEATYLAAQALIKMENRARATEEYQRLREHGDESWKAIGESGAALLAGNMQAAMEAANRAVAANESNPYAHYQVGAVASRQNDFAQAVQAFRRTIELKPDFAYAHYYAGLASQRLKQTAQMSEHLELFMKLAPDAPERAGVAAMLRTLRP